MANNLEDIKKNLKSDKLVIGTVTTLKKIKENKIEKVWLSSNVPESIKKDLNDYNDINAFEIIELGIPNEELGVLLKKQFSVSIVSLAKGEK